MRGGSNTGLIGIVVIAAVVIAGVFALTSGTSDSSSAGELAMAPVADGVTADGVAAETASLQVSEVIDGADGAAESDDLIGDEPIGCTITVRSVKIGSTGDDVECVQRALARTPHYTVEPNGTFDQLTKVAVEAIQRQFDLHVDGIVGPQTANSLGIMPEEGSLVVRTPEPAEGATDLWGVALSPVASTGDDAPAMPDNSGQGTGRRIVYDRAGQRVWAVNDAEQVIRSYLVTGSQYANELTGRHEVYSRSDVSTAWNGAAYLPLMVRWLDTERGAIGFHAIPLHVDDYSPYQTDAELGQRLSGGCQRQHNLDAEFMWAFGTIGTPVYVT